MPSDKLSLGALVTSYWEWNGLGDWDLKRLGEFGYTAREQLLEPILPLLPKGNGITTLDELDRVLWDLASVIHTSAPPDAIAEELCELLQPRHTVFMVPFSRAPDFDIELAIGGRHALFLGPTEVGPWKMSLLHGVIDVGHPIPARRIALTLSEEVAGVLLALDLLRFANAASEDHERQDDPTPIGLSIGVPGAKEGEEVRWTTHTLPWREQYYTWGTILAEPRNLTDLERLGVAREGVAAGLRQRMELAQRLFSVGGMDAKRIRRSARFLRKATTSDDPGDSYLFMATALEGLLVDGQGELQRRVCDAAGLVAGPTFAEREKARGLAEHLYSVRSKYIHEGDYAGSDSRRLEVLQLVRDILASELRTFSRSY